MYFCIWKVKTISVVRRQLFCGQCKAKFLLEFDCINDPHKVQSITDTDNEFTECQTPRKKLQSIGISPVSLHAFMKTLKSDISEAYKVQVDCLKIQSLILMIKMMRKNDLVRLHKEKQEKLKTTSYSKQIQTLTLVHDKWYQIYC